MRDNPDYALTALADAKALIRAHPWATMISASDAGLVASHYPFLLDDSTDDLVLLSHVGRPDEIVHQLGTREVLVVFQGPWGYISPDWYGTGPAVPTWDFSVVHAAGVPELLDTTENLAVLERLVDHFEDPLPNPFRMRRDAQNEEYAERIVHGTIGFRMAVRRWTGKRKLSQDKPPAVVDRIVAALRGPGPYHQPLLADEVERANSARAGRP